nr:F-box only protein 41-like [Lytechinus pictus]
MSAHHGQFPPGRGLSPNAVELGRQITLARQLLMKQKQAESRADAFFKKRSSMRPAAHILPMKKDDGKSGKSTTYLSVADDEDLDDDISLHKPGGDSSRSHYSGIYTSRSEKRNQQNSPLGSARKTGDELLEKWKVQSEMRRLEGKLQEKTKEVAMLETQVNHTLRAAQSKERNLATMKAIWDETAAKQSRARQRLRHYIDDLADRAEKAENQVEDLKTSRTLSRTASISRSSDGYKAMDRLVPSHDHYVPDPNITLSMSRKTMPHQYPPEDHSGLPRTPLGRDGLFPSQGPGHGLMAGLVDIAKSPSGYSHLVEDPIQASRAPEVSHVPHLQSAVQRTVRNASYETPSASVSLGIPSDGGDLSASQWPKTSSYIPAASSINDRDPIFKDENNWNDMDFLEEVMEDVVRKREEQQRQSRHDNPRASPTAVSRGFSPLPSHGVDYSRQSPDYRYDDPGVMDQESGSDVSVTSVSQWSEEGRATYHYRRGKFLHHFEPRKRRVILFLIFSYLRTSTKLKCASVCREWRDVCHQPELWQYVHLRSRQISSKFLKTISVWCTQLKWLTLEKLSSRNRRDGESQDVYLKKIRGCLEPGLEALLQSAGSDLLTFKIVDCPYIITERVLWLASCHCRSLMSVTYISKTDPVGSEVIWALGAGCRQIQSLKIPPKHPCEKPKRFNSACVATIGRCWTQLKALSVGGPSVKVESLSVVVRSCAKLQVLELDHMIKVTEEKAVELCQDGLRGLHTLILRHTPITPSAILHFNGACPQLTRISVHLSLSDFFPLPASPGQRKEFSKAIETLLVLSKKRSLENTLQVRADYK